MVYWLNLTQLDIESEICFLKNFFFKILKDMAKNYHRSSIHIQIHDLGHFLGKIMTLLNLYLVLLLEWSIVACLSPSFLSYIAVLLYTTFKFNFLFLKVIFQERKTTQCSLFEWTKESKFIFAKFRILMSNKCTYILTLGWCM